MNTLRVFICVFVLSLALCFVSFAIAYGYDEGTLRNEFMGEIGTNLFVVLKFPLAYLVPARYLPISLVGNVLMLSSLTSLVVRYYRQKNIIRSPDGGSR